jgi:3-hydroxy-3-methylglutaryl CoA synthase
MQSTPGIVAYGAYLPRLRLERAAIAAATGWASAPRGRPPAGTRSYCNWDEDSITMAVEAARDCLTGHERSRVRWLGMATTTAPFADRSNAGVVATALDARRRRRSTALDRSAQPRARSSRRSIGPPTHARATRS